MYALPCECGQTLPVTPRQAGNEVACPACGNTVKVPNLGEMRNLPQAGLATEQEPTSNSIGLGRRLTFAGFCLVAGIGFFVGVFSLISAATIEVESTTEEHIASDLERLQQAPPGQVTALWREYMVYGLNERHPFPYQEHAEEKAAWMQRGVIGMSLAVVAVAVAIFLARSGRRRRDPASDTADGRRADVGG